MAIRTREELLASINGLVGESTTDETISIIEDLTDTLADFEDRVSDSTDWRNRYEQNDAEWRRRYRDRFFTSDGNEDDDIDGEPENPPLRYEDLFS